MAGMQIRPISDISIAPIVTSAGRVGSPVEAPEKVRETEKPEELDNVVSKSKDGDTVQVSDKSAEKLEDYTFGRMDIVEKDEGKAAKAAAENEDKAGAQVAAEEEKAAVNAQAVPAENAVAEAEEGKNADEKVIPNIASPAAGTEDKEAVKRALEEEEKEKEEEVKAVETEEAKITSFAGYTEDQLKQLYQKGEISKGDFDRQMEIKEALKEESDQETNEEDGSVSKMIRGVLGTESKGGRDEAEIKAAFSEDSSDKTDAAERIAIMDTIERNLLGI